MGALITALWLTAHAASPTPLRLDAGGAHTPVMPGWQALHPDGSTDPRVRIQQPGRASDGGGLDDLARDGIVGTRFTVQLTPGPWVIWVQQVPDHGTMKAFGPLNAGVMLEGRSHPHPWSQPVGAPGAEAIDRFLASPAYAAVPFPTFQPDQTAWDRVVAPKTAWARYTVVVDRDGLQVGPYGVPLTGLIAVPEADAAQGEAMLADVQQARRAQWLTALHPEDAWWPNPAVPPGPLTIEVGRWDALPDARAATPSPTLTRTVRAGAWTSLLLWLHPTAADVQVQVRGLDGLTLHEVHWLDLGEPPQPRRPRPAFLRPTDGHLRGGQGVPVGLALVGRVPSKGPRRWRGTLLLTTDGQTTQVPVQLDVARVPLPPPPLPVGFFLRWPNWLERLDTPDLAITRRVLRDTLAQATERGFTALSVQDAPAGLPLDSTLATWGTLGGTPPFVWRYAPVRSAIYRRDAPADVGPPVADQVADMVRAAPGATHFLFNEEFWRNHRALDQLADLDAAVRAVDPQARTAISCANPMCWDAVGSTDVVMLHEGTRVSRDTVDTLRAAARAKGRPAGIWAYNTTAGRSAPWLAWAAGVDGLMRWQLNPAPADPFDDVLRGATWGYTVLGPDGQVWPTVLLESLAEGVEDLRWLAALDAVADAEPTGEAARLRRSLREALDGGFGVGGWDGEALDPATMDRMVHTIRQIVSP